MTYAYTTPWGTIHTGAAFNKLSFEEKRAVVAHERGHLFYRDGLIRLAWVLSLMAFFFPVAYWVMCVEQEYRADDYAKERGHGLGLVSFLKRLPNQSFSGAGYPSPIDRIRNLS